MPRLSIGPTAAVLILLVLADIASAQAPITIGETKILSSLDSGNRDLLVAQQTVLTVPATLKSVSFYVTRASGRLALGVYDASGPGGGPGTKQAEVPAFTPELGWNTGAVSVPVVLQPGTYWLAFLPSSNKLGFRRNWTGSARYDFRRFGALPTTFSTSPGSQSGHWSLYATLTPATAAAPTVNLSANPTSVPSDGMSTLTWTTTNATSCLASNVGAEGSTWKGPKPLNGSDVRGPLEATATYSLACSGPGGTTSQSVVISVTAEPPPPAPTVSLAATPSTVAPGLPSVLSWSSANATTCTASGGWNGSQLLAGELIVVTTSTTTYTLTCTGAGGSATTSTTLTVIGGAVPLLLTWVDNAAGLALFKIERKIGPGGAFVQIATTLPGIETYLDTTPVTGTMYCYRVRASNDEGDSDYSNETCRTP